MDKQEAPRQYPDEGLIKVFISTRDSTCDGCKEDLGRRAWITLVPDPAAHHPKATCALCLSCAEIDHLVFLPTGDAGVTRRARKHSSLCAVVLKWSSARKRYERQGLLVQEEALERAEAECLADAEARQRRREREAVRRDVRDSQFVSRFAGKIREMFPGSPPGREEQIAFHACQKYSDRVGRSAAARAFDEEAIALAVAAHVRHAETRYDELLGRGVPRPEARERVRDEVAHLLERWRGVARA
jgi:hypothetical protein